MHPERERKCKPLCGQSRQLHWLKLKHICSVRCTSNIYKNYNFAGVYSCTHTLKKVIKLAILLQSLFGENEEEEERRGEMKMKTEYQRQEGETTGGEDEI